MREYLMSVIGAAVVVGIITVVLPDGESGGLKNHVAFIGALCVLGILISPAHRIIDTLYNFINSSADSFGEMQSDEFEEKYAGYIRKIGKDNADSGIARLISEKYGIPRDECRVCAEVFEENGELKIRRVTVILSGKSVFRDPYEIERYISQVFECECFVSG